MSCASFFFFFISFSAINLVGREKKERPALFFISLDLSVAMKRTASVHVVELYFLAPMIYLTRALDMLWEMLHLREITQLKVRLFYFRLCSPRTHVIASLVSALDFSIPNFFNGEACLHADIGFILRYICRCVSIYIHLCSMYLCICMDMDMYIYVYAEVFVCMYVCMYVCICPHLINQAFLLHQFV